MGNISVGPWAILWGFISVFCYFSDGLSSNLWWLNLYLYNFVRNRSSNHNCQQTLSRRWRKSLSMTNTAHRYEMTTTSTYYWDLIHVKYITNGLPSTQWDKIAMLSGGSTNGHWGKVFVWFGKLELFYYSTTMQALIDHKSQKSGIPKQRLLKICHTCVFEEEEYVFMGDNLLSQKQAALAWWMTVINRGGHHKHKAILVKNLFNVESFFFKSFKSTRRRYLSIWCCAKYTGNVVSNVLKKYCNYL